MADSSGKGRPTKHEEALLEQARRIRALHEIISRPDLSFEEQIDETLRLGCKLLGCEIGKVGRQDPENNASEFLNTIVLTDLPVKRGTVLPLDKTFCQITFDSPETIAISNVRESQYRDHPAAEFLGMQSYIGCSINVHGRKFGTVNFSNRTPVERPFDVADQDLVNLVGSWISAMMERQLEAEESRKSKEAADAANQAKSQFLASMSHELRTPLNAIIGYSEMLEEDARAEGLSQYTSDLQKICSAGRHLLSLINDVLDLSKVEAGRMELFVEEFDVHGLVEGVVSTLQPLVQKGGNRLDVIAAEEIGPMRSDMTKLRQILLNLIGNACKFTESGRIELKLERAHVEGRDWTVFSVADSGIGMTPDQMQNVFDPFTQVDSSATRKQGGTGLGLAISRRFCEMLGGTILLDSEFGEGTTFQVWLPTTIDPAPILDTSADAAGPQAAPRRFTRDAHDERRKRVSKVLLIDDDRSVQELVTRFLVQEGFEVLTADDGDSGLRLAKEHRPRVILLDVLMPGIDGWEVLRTLKRDEALRSIPVIMLTMMSDKGLALALGAADFHPKPIDWRQLHDSLISLVRRPRDKSLRSILLVVDDEVRRSTLRRRLEEEDWTVIEAEDGAAAISRLEHCRPTAVLLDLHTPTSDDFGFLSELRSGCDGAQVPVIVFASADIGTPDGQRLDRAVAKVIRKDGFELATLVETVRGLAGRTPETEREETT